MIRVGHGYDVHVFAENRKLMLGGVEIPWEKGLDGHSDADVLVHAVCDAVIGALGLGDIGKLYPDNDDRFLNIDSRILLRDVVDKIHSLGYKVVNVDTTIMAQAPRMAAYESEMIKNVASDLKVDVSCVSIKATTTEKLGFTGRKEGIAVESVALLQKTE